MSLLITSCAHKSGHGRNMRSSHSNVSVNRDTRVERSSNDKVLSGSQIFSKYNSAVFMVFTSDGENVYQGSGFFINSKGLAVSNYHVFKNTGMGNELIKLANDDSEYKVKDVIAKSDNGDYILFTVDVTNTNYIPIARKRPNVGDKVYAIGSPRGLENTFSSGEVSQWREKNVMQISALIDHGSSGGALINEHGEVVGITSGTFYEGSQANLNYAWSIDVIKQYLR
jgi:serine protease Do